jgi:hypothetical protein
MYIQYSINFEVAQDRRREMLAEAEGARLARHAISLARVSQPRQSRRRARRLLRQLVPQAQS